MDKASAYGAGDCRFESCWGHVENRQERKTTTEVKVENKEERKTTTGGKPRKLGARAEV